MKQHLTRGGIVAAAALCLSATTALSPVTATAAMPQALQPMDPGSPIVAVAYDYTVYKVQQELNARGYDAGPQDGLMGARTRSAITAYQRQNDLLVTGQASQSLLAHIQGNGSAAPGTRSADAEAGVNIRRSQRVLRRLGYDLDVTGRMDAQTADAVRDYQRDNNLLATGELTAELQTHLRDSIRDKRQARRQAGADDRNGDDNVSATTLAEIQRGLRARGYDLASASGRLDDRTEAAIRAYQRDSGLRETGEPSSELAELLSKGLAEPVSTPDNIRSVQAALNARGYDAGPEDGVLGPSTRSAIQSYRQNTDLPDSGGMDRQLLSALGIDTGATANAASGSGSGSDTVPAEDAYRLRIGDDFNDGNYVAGSRWSVIAGNFQVDNGALRSRIETGGQQSQQEIGREMIQGVLGQVLGVPVGGSGTDAAAISQDTSFGNAFRLSLRVAGDPSRSAKMNIGPYQGRNVINGYRLVYDAAAARPLSIVASTETGTRTTVASSNAPNLSDGQWHDIVWSRDANGQMLVTIDNSPYLSVTDRGIEGSNTGLSFVNLGGDWKLDDVAVESPAG